MSYPKYKVNDTVFIKQQINSYANVISVEAGEYPGHTKYRYEVVLYLTLDEEDLLDRTTKE